jgi:putative ABC transport system permease protein
MTLFQDLRYGVRVLRKNPAFALIAILTLALGIGASTMIFSIVDAVLLHPFPYQDAGRLVTFHIQQANYAGPPDYSAPEFLDVRNGMRGFEDLIGYSLAQLTYRNGVGSERTTAAWVTSNTFAILGVQPRMGRPLLPEDEKPGAPLVCAIGDRFWREQLNADPNILGPRSI